MLTSHVTPQDVIAFVQAAIECSVYFAPKEPGLTYEEIIEVGQRAGFQPGEIGDALAKVAVSHAGAGAQRFLPTGAVRALWGMFSLPQDPDYRNLAAFDFVHSQLSASVRAEGVARASLERRVIVERAAAQDIAPIHVEAAITIWALTGHLVEKEGLLRFASGREHHISPSQQQSQGPHFPNRRRDEVRVRAYSLVKDVVGRRTDGRPKHAEPFDAFTEALDQLGYSPFRLWWAQAVAELRRADTQSSPVSVSVLAAALVEGALTFVVNHARSLQLGVFRSNDFDGNPRTWKLDDLVKSAAAGGETAILDRRTHQRVESLARTRQRIHAGRMLSEFPGGVPDLRPEEARDAKTTAELAVRRVLDWLQRYPSSHAIAQRAE